MNKKALVLLLMTILIISPFAAPVLQAAPIKVVVEGEDEEKATKEKPVIIVKNTPEKRVSVADLKALADKSALESEVMDAVIAKISDIEEAVKKQKLFDALVVGAFIMLFGMIYFTRRKR